MNDLIRRSEAIEVLENTDWYHQNANKDMVIGANSKEHQAWYKADDVYKALESVPPAEPEPSDDIDNALALLDAIHSSGRMEYYSDYCVLHDAISQISAQLERETGEWERKSFYDDTPICSKCGCEGNWEWDYCPICGNKKR